MGGSLAVLVYVGVSSIFNFAWKSKAQVPTEVVAFLLAAKGREPVYSGVIVRYTVGLG
jgi:hypothetical protein